MKLYKKIILVGTALTTILVGSLIYRNRETTRESQFQDSAYHYLVDDFSNRGLHNLQSPLFDFNDPIIREVYDETKGTATPKVISRDIQSNDDIVNAIERHLSQYGDKSLIIISGAGVHIWGATSTLEDRFDAEYISITPKKLDLGNVMDTKKYSGNETEREKRDEARESSYVQLTRALGVVRQMGYRNLEDYMRHISDFDGARNIVVGIEETGLHSLYSNQDGKPVYQTLSSFIEQFRPKSILYIGENLYSENMRRNFEQGPETEFIGTPQYRELFLAKAKELKIPVEFASFGM